MHRTTHGRILRRLWRGLLPGGLGGISLGMVGCAALAGAGGVLAAGLLTGLFLGSIQASFAATAHSYAYSDSGVAQWVFNRPPHNSNIELSRFIGRLPGFYFVLVDLDDKAIRQAQGLDPLLYETDVEVDFSTVPPTLTGTIREQDGGAEFPITDAYPEMESLSLSVLPGSAVGEYDVRLSTVLRGVEGERLDYGLVWHARLGTAGLAMEGQVEVERVLTTADGKKYTNVGTGSATTNKG